jgi:two-component system, cell cycle response regulator
LIDASIWGNGHGLRLMSELRSRPATRHAAVCMLQPKGSSDSVAMAFDMGADDVVGADVGPNELALRLQTLIRRKRREDQLRATVQDGLRMAMIDPLTGLHNRRYAMPQLSAIAARAAAEASIFAVMVVDLDRFKSVNDRLGHAAGDAVLVEVAARLQANLREGDLLARIGGEEFLVALPSTNFQDACNAAGRLCRAIEENPIQLGFATELQVTVSIGLAVSDEDFGVEPAPRIVDRADRALLTAKAEGRNKVTISKSAA